MYFSRSSSHRPGSVRPVPLAIAALVALGSVGPLAAQLEPPSTGGTAALAQARRMLGHEKRVLVIGAHPDDEDTELLTVLVRSMGAETGYLALNRGEGGQNLIGPELGEALGILRSEELLAARRLDGARQYFTRAYDFGFSKSLDDTWAHWPRDSVLKDVVRTVRRFRPQIVVAIFSGTPRDGHGQHQASGWAAREAFRVAGDSTRFPELAGEEGLAPWTPLKLYRSSRYDTAGTTLVLNGGLLDEAVGRTFHQIAMESRSRHQSQDMGQLQEIGPSPVPLQLEQDRTGRGRGGFFAGIDTTDAALARMPAGAPEVADRRRREFDARAAASGLLVDAVADRAHVIAGQTIAVSVRAASGRAGDPAVTVVARAIPPSAWGAASAPSCTIDVSAGGAGRCELRVVVPASADLTVPYYLRQPRQGAMYRWNGAPREALGAPFQRPLSVVFDVRRGDSTLFEVAREVAFREKDQARGELRRPVDVVPRLDVKLDRDTLLLSTDAPRAQRIVATVGNAGGDSAVGRVRLELPTGWAAVAPQPFVLAAGAGRESFAFDVRPPAGLAPGRYEIRAVAESGGERFADGIWVVDHPHVRPRGYRREAAVSVVAAPVALPRLTRVGYVRGAADRVPEALASIGVPVELLDAAALERGDFSRYDAIVVGPRAYETDPALVEHNGRLLAYARGGGLVIVQYQQYQFVTGRFAPFPLTIASPHDRVADERAPVTAIAPGHAALSAPNALGPADWGGWVQERGLYFARTWDPAYVPVIESADPGSAPLRGGLLIAPVGRGTFVYTGIAFFRQLPAGVPGAFRLFANLLALPRGATP